MSETIIETKGLTKKYGEKVAVNALDLSIHKGEIFGLLGPNGAGKTTTILMLLGLTEPTEGSATIMGLNCRQNPIQVKREVGYLPDNPGFYPDLTGRQNLAVTGRINGLKEDEIQKRSERLLKRVGLTASADQKASTYSKGMRQRLGIADVLMKDSQIIIMDEPTLGLDPAGVKELLNLLTELSKEDGRTLLISSHQLYQVQQICDRVGIFVGGHLIACGKIEDLGEQIQQETHYTLELQVDPCDDRLLAEISKQGTIDSIHMEGTMLVVESRTDMRKTLTQYLGSNGYAINHMHQRGGDLDEIYRQFFEKGEAQIQASSAVTGVMNKLNHTIFGRRHQA